MIALCPKGYPNIRSLKGYSAVLSELSLLVLGKSENVRRLWQRLLIMSQYPFLPSFLLGSQLLSSRWACGHPAGDRIAQAPGHLGATMHLGCQRDVGLSARYSFWVSSFKQPGMPTHLFPKSHRLQCNHGHGSCLPHTEGRQHPRGWHRKGFRQETQVCRWLWGQSTPTWTIYRWTLTWGRKREGDEVTASLTFHIFGLLDYSNFVYPLPNSVATIKDVLKIVQSLCALLKSGVLSCRRVCASPIPPMPIWHLLCSRHCVTCSAGPSTDGVPAVTVFPFQLSGVGVCGMRQTKAQTAQATRRGNWWRLKGWQGRRGHLRWDRMQWCRVGFREEGTAIPRH